MVCRRVRAILGAKTSLSHPPCLAAGYAGSVRLVDRSSACGITAQAIEIFRHHKDRGTYFGWAKRQRAHASFLPGWRSGFTEPAAGADVPLGVVRWTMPSMKCACWTLSFER